MDTIAHARELADEILAITKGAGISGDKQNEQAELEAYYALLEDREPLVDELLELKLQIDEEEAATPEFGEVKKVIEQITEMDKKHLAFIKKIHKTVQASYKEVKLGQRLTAGYNAISSYETASQFDINT